MAFFKQALVEEIEARVSVWYVDQARCMTWNASRPDGALRLLTGFCWIEKTGQRRVRGGFKSRSVALRDAYYTILQGLETAPGLETRPRLTVAKRKAA